jgi:hypothetical protein
LGSGLTERRGQSPSALELPAYKLILKNALIPFLLFQNIPARRSAPPETISQSLHLAPVESRPAGRPSTILFF